MTEKSLNRRWTVEEAIDFIKTTSPIEHLPKADDIHNRGLLSLVSTRYSFRLRTIKAADHTGNENRLAAVVTNDTNRRNSNHKSSIAMFSQIKQPSHFSLANSKLFDPSGSSGLFENTQIARYTNSSIVSSDFKLPDLKSHNLVKKSVFFQNHA